MIRKKLIKSEVIQLFNTTKETLRHYEQKGILNPEIGENNYRFYDFKDLQKLREIFLFRDLELSLDEMRQLDERNLEKEDYIDLLKNHYGGLQQKVQRLQNIQRDIKQLVELLEKGENQRSYLLRREEERRYYLLDPMEADVMNSPKAYFDKYQDLIKTVNYSEKTLQIVYPYDSLSDWKMDNVQLCLSLPTRDNMVSSDIAERNRLNFPAGTYLSIFYPFRHGKYDVLKGLQAEIDEYLKANGLRRIGTIVLELEHPELSLFLEEDTLIYELQIQVEDL